MKKGQAPHTDVLVKNQKGYIDCRSAPLRNKGCQPDTRLPSQNHQC